MHARTPEYTLYSHTRPGPPPPPHALMRTLTAIHQAHSPPTPPTHRPAHMHARTHARTRTHGSSLLLAPAALRLPDIRKSNRGSLAASIKPSPLSVASRQASVRLKGTADPAGLDSSRGSPSPLKPYMTLEQMVEKLENSEEPPTPSSGGPVVGSSAFSMGGAMSGADSAPHSPVPPYLEDSKVDVMEDIDGDGMLDSFEQDIQSRIISLPNVMCRAANGDLYMVGLRCVGDLYMFGLRCVGDLYMAGFGCEGECLPVGREITELCDH